MIAVPADFERLYAPHERRLALEHELAHHRSGDLIANLFAFVLLCLQWFNPLAWVAHAAFRFDQEAACDARVLDKAKADDRADYGRAIAKAASGRALLFASALDRRNTLHRRLKSMLSNPSSGRRMAGRLMVVAAVAVALPLTATRAINYIDVPSPAAPAAPAVPAVAAAPAAPAGRRRCAGRRRRARCPGRAGPTRPGRCHCDDEGTIHINGKTKQWRDLTPAEKAEVRQRDRPAPRPSWPAPGSIARKSQREIREAMADAKIDKEELRRDLAEARVEIDRAMREVDAHAVEIRRSGQNPEQIKATIRASLKAVEAIDVEAITRQALASVDHEAIEGQRRGGRSVDRTKAEAEIERIEERYQRRRRIGLEAAQGSALRSRGVRGWEAARAPSFVAS